MQIPGPNCLSWAESVCVALETHSPFSVEIQMAFGALHITCQGLSQNQRK